MKVSEISDIRQHYYLKYTYDEIIAIKHHLSYVLKDIKMRSVSSPMRDFTLSDIAILKKLILDHEVSYEY